jgi:parvulin-like peptidyl-prolyl isomerase
MSPRDEPVLGGVERLNAARQMARGPLSVGQGARLTQKVMMSCTTLAAVMLCVLVAGSPAGAVLVDKILAVVNNEVLTLQDFEDHLALRRVFQPGGGELDRSIAFERFVEQTLLRQEALRTRIVQVDDAEVSQQIQAVQQQPDRALELERVMRERGLSLRDMHTWLRKQLTTRAFIDRRVRLFVRVSEDQIRQYYQQHQQNIGEPLTDTVREQIRRLLVEQQVNARLVDLVGDLRRKASLDFPP